MRKNRGIRNLILILFIGLITLNQGIAQTHDNSSFVHKRQQKRWIKSTVKQMDELAADKNLKSIEQKVTEFEGFYQKSYRLKEKGFVKFENGETVVLVSNSSHTNQNVGDITLAMDSKKQIFKNEGHICGGIINFVIKEKSGISSPEQFFKLSVNDTEEKGWKQIK